MKKLDIVFISGVIASVIALAVMVMVICIN